jgi:hypothetical protein
MPQPKIDRRGWLAWFLQKRRRERADTVGILLSSDGHGHLNWACNVSGEFGFSISYSADGVTWSSYDGTGGELYRDCSGIAGYFRVCQADENGYDVLPYSNAVHSDGL